MLRALFPMAEWKAQRATQGGADDKLPLQSARFCWETVMKPEWFQ